MLSELDDVSRTLPDPKTQLSNFPGSTQTQTENGYTGVFSDA
jgi:hypothetical protein